MNGVESAAALNKTLLISSHIRWCQVQDAPGSQNGTARGPPNLAPGKSALEGLKTIPVMTVIASFVSQALQCNQSVRDMAGLRHLYKSIRLMAVNVKTGKVEPS